MKRFLISQLENHINDQVNIKGWIYRIRKLKSITFIILRDMSGLVQCVLDNNRFDISEIKLETVISAKGVVKESKNKLNPFEIQINELVILNAVKDELPIEINTNKLEVNLNTMLNNRMLSLRHKKINSIFKIQNIISNGFREYLNSQGFTEISTPKIVQEGAEGGTEVFKLKYFEKDAYLAQSPQFYKQLMVGAGFERVFEIGHVYRAEEHNTTRHLNEYVSMDLEIGFIENEEELMNLEENLIKSIFRKISSEGEEYLNILGVNKPELSKKIPRVSFSDAIEILKTKYNKTDLDGDMDPEGEKLICKYAKEQFNSEFIFLTNYPRKKRPMYTMPLGENFTHSFDLLYKGIEITTGGQRIHNYNMLIENFKYKGLNPEDYHSYISNFKYGMPPHGGLAIGLERLTCQILNLSNIREASLIPRDRTRLIP